MMQQHRLMYKCAKLVHWKRNINQRYGWGVQGKDEKMKYIILTTSITAHQLNLSRYIASISH